MTIRWNLGDPPPHESYYLITDQNGNMQVAYWTDADLLWGRSCGRWRWINMSQFTRVVAWMPLPEPYKGDKS